MTASDACSARRWWRHRKEQGGAFLRFRVEEGKPFGRVVSVIKRQTAPGESKAMISLVSVTEPLPLFEFKENARVSNAQPRLRARRNKGDGDLLHWLDIPMFDARETDGEAVIADELIDGFGKPMRCGRTRKGAMDRRR